MNNSKHWLTEYEAFLNAEKIAVPQEHSKKVFLRIKQLLNPGAGIVFTKVLSIHFFVGLISLSVCHQFGINPFGTTSTLDGWFMAKWGHSACMIFCGFLFVGLSVLSAGYFLSIEEVKALRRTEFLQTLALGAFSLSIFAAFGAHIALALAGLWLLGAFFGGFLATEALWKLKRYNYGPPH